MSFGWAALANPYLAAATVGVQADDSSSERGHSRRVNRNTSSRSGSAFASPGPADLASATERRSGSMSVLVLFNDPPYGTERCFDALRLAGTLAKRDTDVRTSSWGAGAMRSSLKELSEWTLWADNVVTF
jgi:hypothetical protein